MAAHGFEAHSRENARRASVDHLASARRLVAAGVALTIGTDIPPGDRTDGTTAVVREAELLVEAGLTAQQALATSTTTPARMCGLADETGRVTTGFSADLAGDLDGVGQQRVLTGGPDAHPARRRRDRRESEGGRLEAEVGEDTDSVEAEVFGGPSQGGVPGRGLVGLQRDRDLTSSRNRLVVAPGSRRVGVPGHQVRSPWGSTAPGHSRCA